MSNWLYNDDGSKIAIAENFKKKGFSKKYLFSFSFFLIATRSIHLLRYVDIAVLVYVCGLKA